MLYTIKTNEQKKLPHGKESTEVRLTQKIGKKEGTLTEKMKRSPDKRHTQTHGSLIGTIQ